MAPWIKPLPRKVPDPIQQYDLVYDFYETRSLDQRSDVVRAFLDYEYMFMPTRHDGYYWSLRIYQRGVLLNPAILWCNERLEGTNWVRKGEWIFVRNEISAFEFRMRWC
jgi:hypothetical protein